LALPGFILAEMKEREIRPGIQDVRDFSKRVIASTTLLTIDDSKIKNELAPLMAAFKESVSGGPDQFADPDLTPENELGINVFFNVVNYCFQSPDNGEEFTFISPDGKKILRSSGLKASMIDSGVNWGNFYEAAYMSESTWNTIWNPTLNSHFYKGFYRGLSIRDTARKFIKKDIKTPSDLLIASHFNAEELITNLLDSGHFTDPFLKRAQLAVHLINSPLKRRFGVKIKGAEDMTVMADYRLPQLLYNTGAIELSPELESKLLKRERIISGSPEEVALRAATIVAGEKLSAELLIPEPQVDSLMWLAARKLDKEKKLPIPHMIVATDAY
jgi:hypothetical protein